MEEITELIKKGQDLIKEGELQIKEGEIKIKDGKDQIKNGEELIIKGKLKIEEGKKNIEDGKGKNKPECSKVQVFPYKLEWYQSEVQVVVEVLVKNVKFEDFKIDFKESTLTISLNIKDECVKELNLLHEINPSLSTYKVLPSKIEIKLAKKDGGHWTCLEKTEEKKKMNIKNWDKVVAQIEETKDSDEMLNELFQKIYSEGSDEVKKAMNKSFLESGGTELNTNWDAVKKGTVSVKPPQGMEWKSWES